MGERRFCTPEDVGSSPTSSITHARTYLNGRVSGFHPDYEGSSPFVRLRLYSSVAEQAPHKGRVGSSILPRATTSFLHRARPPAIMRPMRHIVLATVIGLLLIPSTVEARTPSLSTKQGHQAILWWEQAHHSAYTKVSYCWQPLGSDLYRARRTVLCEFSQALEVEIEDGVSEDTTWWGIDRAHRVGHKIRVKSLGGNFDLP